MTMSNDELMTLVRELPIPTPWDRDAFVANIADMRGRPIRLIPTATRSLADSPCGLWIATDDEDVIVHENCTSDYHIDQIVCHEIGHMILGHGVAQAGPDDERGVDILDHLLPSLPPAMVRSVLGRHDVRADEERDAEMFASMILLVTEEGIAAKSVMRSVFLNKQ